MDRLFRDLRHTLRIFRRAPGFSGVVLVTLALGIGGTTAIFAVVDGVVLRPLPYPEAERLVSIAHPVSGLNSDWVWAMSSGGYFFFQDNNRSLDELGVYAVSEMSFAGADVAERVPVAQVSATLFDVLGARPAHGRLLTAPDNRSEAAPLSVAVLGHEFWRSRFGGEMEVLGTTIQIEGQPVEIVGIAEPGLSLPDQEVAVWAPMALDPGMYHANSHWREAIGRLAPGVSVAAAQTDLGRLTDRLPEAVPTAYGPSFMEEARFSTAVVPLREELVGDVDGVLWILLGAVGVVLVIACANVANLFLVRMEGRRRELAVCSALGASRGDVARSYLTESVLLALIAGVVGLLLAYGGVRLLLALAPADIPRLGEIGIGWPVVAFAAVVSLITGIGLGLLPLARSVVDYTTLREGSRGLTASRGQQRLRSALVIGQVALALVLLASAGLLFRTFSNLRAVETGLEPEGVITIEVSLPSASYQGYDAVAGFYRDLMTRVAGLPGAERIGATNGLPLGGGYGGCNIIFIEGWDATQERYPCAPVATVTPGYFEALGIPVRGRAADWTDNLNGVAGAVVSRAFAEAVWPDEDPIGKGVTGNYSNQPYLRVVGVADDVRAAGLDEPPVEAVYLPVVPPDSVRLWGPVRSMTLAIESTTSRPEQLAAAVRRIVRDLDPGVPVGAVRTMDDVIAAHDSISRVSFAMVLLGIAAGVALLLGAVGLYGVIAYVVGQRTGEIGVRMALGARNGQVAGLVVRQSAVLTLAGVGIGVVAALGTVRLLRSLLFGVGTTDPATLAGVSVLLIAVALVASFLPARRAAAVDPVEALRAE